MPRGDRTGPLGEGPMTGLRKGRCADENTTSGFGGFGFGRGSGRGFGFGRGLGWRVNNIDKESEAGLKSTIDVLKAQLQSLESRLKNLRSND